MKNTFITVLFFIFTQITFSHTFNVENNGTDTYIPGFCEINDSSRASETFGGYPRYLIDGSDIPNTSNFRTVPAICFTAFTAGGFYAIHRQLSDVWWKANDKTHFFFTNDWNTSYQADKFGHYYATYILSAYFTEGLMFSGLKKNSSANWGAACGFIYQMYVEILDGLYAPWGFSLTDMAADLSGSGTYLLHNYFPETQHIIPKWNTFPPRWLGDKDWVNKKTWFDMYNTTSYWFSADLYHFLPENLKKFWLPWLNISVGYAVRGFETDQLTRKYLLAFDYNLLAIFPNSHGTVRWFLHALNYLKFPSPTIEFSDEVKCYLFFPFEIKL